jgi:hypothetical protein
MPSIGSEEPKFGGGVLLLTPPDPPKIDGLLLQSPIDTPKVLGITAVGQDTPLVLGVSAVGSAVPALSGISAIGSAVPLFNGIATFTVITNGLLLLNAQQVVSVSKKALKIIYKGFEGVGNLDDLVIYEWSLTGAFLGEQETMTPLVLSPEHSGVVGLDFTPTGATFQFLWDIQEDFNPTEPTDIYFRLMANDGTDDTNIISGRETIDLKPPRLRFGGVNFGHGNKNTFGELDD